MASSISRIPARRYILRPCTCLRSAPLPPKVRYASSIAPQRGYKIGHLFLGLAFLGVSATSYGLYLFYNTFLTWPSEVRGTLRSAVRAKQTGDVRNSEKFFRKALQDAKVLPKDALGRDRSMKISGIAAALADLLEGQGNLGAAYEVYEEAFFELKDSQDYNQFSGPDKMRTIALAQKSAEIAQAIGEKDLINTAEERLGWAVTELLRLAAPNRATTEEKQAQTALGDKDLDLPSWISVTDLGASLENLGSFYLKQGNTDYATPLFNASLKLLLRNPSLSERCHAGTIANNMSSSFALQPTKDNLNNASQWAQNAMHITKHAISEAEKTGKQEEVVECKPCLAVAIFNYGLVNEMQGNREIAMEQFVSALAKSQEIRFVEGSRQALLAMQRLKERS